MALSKEETDRIQADRGKVITNFAFLESIISIFISRHYFANGNDNFIAEVLDDQYFSFELKRRIFTRILKKYHEPIAATFPNKELQRMQEIRNIVAHGTMIADYSTAIPDKVTNISFKHAGERHQATELLVEYFSLSEPVQTAITSLPDVTTVLVG